MPTTDGQSQITHAQSSVGAGNSDGGRWRETLVEDRHRMGRVRYTPSHDLEELSVQLKLRWRGNPEAILDLVSTKVGGIGQ